MKQANQTTGVMDRLLEPDNRLLGTGSAVVFSQAVFAFPHLVPGGRHGDRDEQGVGGPRDEGEQGGLVEGVDVVEGEGGW